MQWLPFFQSGPTINRSLSTSASPSHSTLSFDQSFRCLPSTLVIFALLGLSHRLTFTLGGPTWPNCQHPLKELRVTLATNSMLNHVPGLVVLTSPMWAGVVLGLQRSGAWYKTLNFRLAADHLPNDRLYHISSVAMLQPSKSIST